MRLQPESIAELRDAFIRAGEQKSRIDSVDLSRMSRVLEYAPEDMTITVETGITLAKLQSTLGEYRQWLPLDPPAFVNQTLEHLLSWNLSGPRRFCFGTARDYLIGARILLGSGNLIKAGGKVVKNVAGYDLCKLFIGARQTLGIIVEASFKVRPVAEREEFLEATCASLEEAEQIVERLLGSNLTPHVLDLHHMTEPAIAVIVGFAGTSAEVESQIAQATQMGSFVRGTLAHNDAFWTGDRSDKIGNISVLPSKIFETIRQLGPGPWIARAGDGIVYHKGQYSSPSAMPIKLTNRLKAAYDPNGVLPLFPE